MCLFSPKDNIYNDMYTYFTVYKTNNILYPEDTVDIAMIKGTCKNPDLVTSDREKVDVEFVNIHGDLADGL